MKWRQMTAEETMTRPEAQLSGSLLAIVLVAGALALAGALYLIAGLFIVVQSGGRLVDILEGAFRGPAGLGAIYMLPTIYMMGWALIFSVMSATRAAAAPGFAAGGLVGWVGVRALIGVIGQVVIASRYNSGGASFLISSILPMLLSVLGEVILVAGFWVYMRDGARPNAYYRRRVRA